MKKFNVYVKGARVEGDKGRTCKTYEMLTYKVEANSEWQAESKIKESLDPHEIILENMTRELTPQEYADELINEIF